MGLFSKKVCDICGGDIGLLGNRKLDDGNMCKDCAKKMSPYFSDRRRTSVADMRVHLAEREENWRQLQFIHPTRVLGNSTKVYIDDDAGKFFVSRTSDWHKENPDLLDISSVIDCVPNVNEHRHEIYRDTPEGRRSFNPPRYRYSYSFHITINVDNPWFSEIHFELTTHEPEDKMSREYMDYEDQAMEICRALRPSGFESAQGINSLGDFVNAVAAAAAAANTQQPQPTAQPIPRPQPTAQPVSEGKVQARVPFGAARPNAPADDGTWTCSCGSVNTGKFCPNCGNKRPEAPARFVCSKCGWTPEDPTNPPRFCPNCGDRFGAEDQA